MHATQPQKSLMDDPVGNPKAGAANPPPHRIREWVRNDKVKIGAAVLLLAIASVVAYLNLRQQDPSQTTKFRLMIDSETNATFRVRIVEGDRFPLLNPETGQRTLYPVETCFWTRDGKARLEPTYVFVKEYAGINEKTYCPDCGREVRRHNAAPPDKLMIEAAERDSAK